MERRKVFVDDGELEAVLEEIENHVGFAREQVQLLTQENAHLWWKARKLGEYAAMLRAELKRLKSK